MIDVQSLNNESLAAFGAVYAHAMHRPGPLSRTEREIIGVVVSRELGCSLSLTRHAAGLASALPWRRRGITTTLAAGDAAGLSARERAIAGCAAKLAADARAVTRQDVRGLLDAGLDEDDVVDLVRDVAYAMHGVGVVMGAEGGTARPVEQDFAG